MSLGFGFMNGGRGSSEEENALAQPWTPGLFPGSDGLVADGGLNVAVVGASASPQVFISENINGYKYVLDEDGKATFALTRPAANSYIATIVAAASGTAIRTDEPKARNPDECEWFVVYGSAAAVPVEPTDTQIRAAITSQSENGLNGATAIVAPVANVVIASNTTDITNSLITQKYSKVSAQKIDFATFPKARIITFSNFSGRTNTTTSTLETKVIDELVPGWTYLVIVNVGMVVTTGGATALVDIGNIGMPANRIRGAGNQSSPSWSTIRSVTSDSLSLTLNARCTASTYDIEQPQVTFVPLYETS